jgi:hypothetical protein
MRSRLKPILFAALAVAASCTDTNGPSLSCNRGTLAPGALVTGTLSRNACTTNGGGEFAQTYVDYNVIVTSGERYLFTLTSEAAWRPQLELHNDADPGAGPRLGRSDDINGAGAHSEILFVSPYNGKLRLRVTAALGGLGEYSLRSQQCGGSSQEITGTGTVSAEGSIDATDCVVHERLMANDSAHADTYVVYLGRNEAKTIKVQERFVGDGFVPAIVFTGPFVVGDAASILTYSVTTLDSLVVQVQGGNVAGDYILAVAGRTPTTGGAYVLTVGPPAP